MSDEIKCPKCGSSQITANKKGFSAGKAAAGVVLTGGIGLAAGAIGRNKIFITCLNCGHKFKPGEGRKEQNLPPIELYSDAPFNNVKLTDDKLIDILQTDGYMAAISEYSRSEKISQAQATKKIDMLMAIYKIVPRSEQISENRKTSGGCFGTVLLFALIAAIIIFFVSCGKDDVKPLTPSTINETPVKDHKLNVHEKKVFDKLIGSWNIDSIRAFQKNEDGSDHIWKISNNEIGGEFNFKSDGSISISLNNGKKMDGVKSFTIYEGVNNEDTLRYDNGGSMIILRLTDKNLILRPKDSATKDHQCPHYYCTRK